MTFKMLNILFKKIDFKFPALFYEIDQSQIDDQVGAILNMPFPCFRFVATYAKRDS